MVGHPALLDSECVSMLTIDPEICSNCDEDPVTHTVMFDMVNNGMGVEVFRGCSACASDVAARLAESLPSVPAARGERE